MENASKWVVYIVNRGSVLDNWLVLKKNLVYFFKKDSSLFLITSLGSLIYLHVVQT